MGKGSKHLRKAARRQAARCDVVRSELDQLTSAGVRSPDVTIDAVALTAAKSSGRDWQWRDAGAIAAGGRADQKHTMPSKRRKGPPPRASHAERQAELRARALAHVAAVADARSKRERGASTRDNVIELAASHEVGLASRRAPRTQPLARDAYGDVSTTGGVTGAHARRWTPERVAAVILLLPVLVSSLYIFSGTPEGVRVAVAAREMRAYVSVWRAQYVPPWAVAAHEKQNRERAAEARIIASVPRVELPLSGPKIAWAREAGLVAPPVPLKAPHIAVPPPGRIVLNPLVIAVAPPNVPEPGRIEHGALALPTQAPFVRSPGAIVPYPLAMPQQAPDMGVDVARGPDAVREAEPDEVAVVLPSVTAPVVTAPIVTGPVVTGPVPPVAGHELAQCRPEDGVATAAGLEPRAGGYRDGDDGVSFGLALAAAARAQTQELVVYNADYVTLAYPGGDVSPLYGVCSDVVVRAYRALNIDLQELVYRSRSSGGDPNIDHRRTDVLRAFFTKYGASLPVTGYSEDYLPGDVVTYHRPENRGSTAHIAVVSDKFARSGRPMIVHNRGWGVLVEDGLFVDQITGHYRFRGLAPDLMAALPRPAPKTATSVAAAVATPSGMRDGGRAPISLAADRSGGVQAMRNRVLVSRATAAAARRQRAAGSAGEAAVARVSAGGAGASNAGTGSAGFETPMSLGMGGRGAGGAGGAAEKATRR